MRINRRLAVCLLLLSLGANRLWAADPTAEDLRTAGAPENGLVVQVGATSGAVLVDLTLEGKRLVQGLVSDDAGRAAVLRDVLASGRHPFATVVVWDGAPRLPYADRLVNLLILDRDQLGAAAPTPEECARVVIPGGIVLERRGGVWAATRTPRPPSIGNWTDFDGGPDGNAVASDTESTGIHGLQWIDNAREVRWAKTGPHGGEGGNIRVWDRYAVIDARIFPEDKDPKFPRRSYLECRDANNGLLLWQIPRTWEISARRWDLSVDDGECFTYLKEGGPLTALDLASGKILRTYPGSEMKPWAKAVSEHDAARGDKPKMNTGIYGDSHWVRLCKDMVLANGDGTLRAWSRDGQLRWTFARPDCRFEFPTVDVARGQVYGLVTRDRIVNFWGKGVTTWGRWPSSLDVVSLVALDLKTGAVKWENTDVASRDTEIRVGDNPQVAKPARIAFGQLLVAGDHVIAYNTASISGGQAFLIASIDGGSGKTVAFDPGLFTKKAGSRTQWTMGGYIVLYRDGVVYIMGASAISSFDPRSGELKPVFSLPWNARCHKPVATAADFLLGQTAFIKKDFSGAMFAVARSGCAHSPVPAAGVLMFGPHTCACTTHFDGFLATTARPAPASVPDDRRTIVPVLGEPLAVPPAGAAPADTLLSQGWGWFTISETSTASDVELAGWSFHFEPQRHQMTARKEAASWTFVADARIGSDVAVVGDRVVVGCHDGQVYGLDLATGAVRWRTLVAPARRLIVANGMLTSAWPVFGVADIGQGQIVASAGTHVELDGGVRVVALNAADGSNVWTKTLQVTPSPIPDGGGKGTVVIDRTLINAAPRFEDGKIVINGGFHLGHIEFEPTEPEGTINARIGQRPKNTFGGPGKK